MVCIKVHTAAVKSIIHSPNMLRSAFTLVALIGYASAQLKLVLTMASTSQFF